MTAHEPASVGQRKILAAAAWHSDVRCASWINNGARPRRRGFIHGSVAAWSRVDGDTRSSGTAPANISLSRVAQVLRVDGEQVERDEVHPGAVDPDLGGGTRPAWRSGSWSGRSGGSRWRPGAGLLVTPTPEAVSAKGLSASREECDRVAEGAEGLQGQHTGLGPPCAAGKSGATLPRPGRCRRSPCPRTGGVLVRRAQQVVERIGVDRVPDRGNLAGCTGGVPDLAPSRVSAGQPGVSWSAAPKQERLTHRQDR
jgi:hypothetical protein